MRFFWTVLFPVFCEAKIIKENATEIMEGTEDYRDYPIDFRCSKFSLMDFKLAKEYIHIIYVATPDPRNKKEKIGCANIAAKHDYPPVTGRDPMMVFYIAELYKVLTRVNADSTMYTGGFTHLERRKFFCNDIKRKMMEIISNCHIFRQIRESYNSKLYEKLCLDEEGCYNVIEYYEEDLPYCVKLMAINQFKNASVASWHHSIINYCKLTDMVSGAKESKYEQLKLKGKSKRDLTKMCLYLRHRLLPDEGKETEMPDPDALHEEDDTTTAEYGNGISEITAFWTMACVMSVNM